MDNTAIVGIGSDSIPRSRYSVIPQTIPLWQPASLHSVCRITSDERVRCISENQRDQQETNLLVIIKIEIEQSSARNLSLYVPRSAAENDVLKEDCSTSLTLSDVSNLRNPHRDSHQKRQELQEE
jgi:hypothetical protein